MDWVLNSLDSSSSERLFLWLLITCIPDFWTNLTSSRRRGKRLAQLLLGHAEKARNSTYTLWRLLTLTYRSIAWVPTLGNRPFRAC
jgi:hypothetical protein